MLTAGKRPAFFLSINTYFMNTLTDKELNDLLSLMVMVGQQPSIKAYDPILWKGL